MSSLCCHPSSLTSPSPVPTSVPAGGDKRNGVREAECCAALSHSIKELFKGKVTNAGMELGCPSPNFSSIPY